MTENALSTLKNNCCATGEKVLRNRRYAVIHIKSPKNAREAFKMTQAQWGTVVGMSRSSICHVEHGDRKLNAQQVKVYREAIARGVGFLFDYSTIVKFTGAMTAHVWRRCRRCHAMFEIKNRVDICERCKK